MCVLVSVFIWRDLYISHKQHRFIYHGHTMPAFSKTPRVAGDSSDSPLINRQKTCFVSKVLLISKRRCCRWSAFISPKRMVTWGRSSIFSFKPGSALEGGPCASRVNWNCLITLPHTEFGGRTNGNWNPNRLKKIRFHRSDAYKRFHRSGNGSRCTSSSISVSTGRPLTRKCQAGRFWRLSMN